MCTILCTFIIVTLAIEPTDQSTSAIYKRNKGNMSVKQMLHYQTGNKFTVFLWL